MSDQMDIPARMSELGDLERSGLRVAWIELFETAPPHHLSMTFMRKAIIHEEQCRRFGGLSPALKRALKAAADGKPVKVFDETGDRLTPSHTKTAKGRRLRYYVSHRLIRSSGKKDPGGWRLPGPELENAVVTLVAGYLNEPEVAANIVGDATTEDLVVFRERLLELNRKTRSPDTEILALIERIDIVRGRISAALDHEAVAEFLNVNADRINGDLMVTSSEFRHRKRGVETRIILAGAAAPRDETLFRNIARANRYLTMIISGQTFTDIGETEGVTGRRIQQLIELSFLAPEVIRDVFEGRQPIGLTTEWLLRHAYPAGWKDQREIFRSL